MDSVRKAELHDIVHKHLWSKSLHRDDQGRQYGWTDAEIDALLKDLGVV